MNSFMRRLHFLAKLKSLREEGEDLNRQLSEMLKASQEENWSFDDRESERQYLYSLMSLNDDLIAQQISGYWIREADRLMVPIPSRDENGMWEEANQLQRHFLSIKGVDLIRKAIREERKALLEPWKQVIATIFSIVSVIVGWLLGKVS